MRYRRGYRFVALLLLAASLTGVLGMGRTEARAAGKPSFTVMKRTKKTATIKIKKQGGVTGYQVYVRMGKKGKYQLVMGTKSLTYKLTRLKADKTYYVKIRSYKTRGYRITRGKFSKVVKIGKYTKPKPKPEEEEDSSESYAQDVLDLVNEQRAAAGVGELVLDEALCEAASKRAEEIVERFEHVRPDGAPALGILAEYGCTYTMAGENIAAGQQTPEAVMESWMNSEGHRANILNPTYHKLGVGFCKDENGDMVYYWTQLFTD